ncbi:MAG: tetratricopeptide repeat protein [Nitrospinae bacterium]|nr:tetratricopeptide repeat protein [Nitrospinota bacterium]
MKKIVLGYLVVISMFLSNISNADMLNLSDYTTTSYNSGIDYYNKGEYHSAIEEFSRVIANHPDFAPAYYLRGIVYNDKGEHANAINDFQKACDMRYEDGCKALHIIS